MGPGAESALGWDKISFGQCHVLSLAVQPHGGGWLGCGLPVDH